MYAGNGIYSGMVKHTLTKVTIGWQLTGSYNIYTKVLVYSIRNIS